MAAFGSRMKRYGTILAADSAEWETRGRGRERKKEGESWASHVWQGGQLRALVEQGHWGKKNKYILLYNACERYLHR